MTRIQLKPNSAEYADGKEKPPVSRCCDMPGCDAEGEHKAPKSRDAINDYYWFCLVHVQEYNKAWDYFSGMSQIDIEAHIIRSMLWDRPTHRYDGNANMKENLYRKAWQTYNFTEEEPTREQKQDKRQIDHNTPEFQAMSIMGLAPPLTLASIKVRYKELVKKHHPDVNGGNPESEELLKSINMAYTILKLACEKFDKIAAE